MLSDQDLLLLVVVRRSCFFCLLILYILVRVTLLSETELDNLLPIFEHGIKPIILASFNSFAFPYLESVLFLFFCTTHTRPQKVEKDSNIKCYDKRQHVFFHDFANDHIISDGVVADLMFPTYFIDRTISIGEFLQRFEIIVSIFWYVTIFFRFSLLLYISAQGLADVFRLRSANSLLIPLLLIVLAMVQSIWPNISYIIDFNPIWPYYAMIFGVIFPVVIWLTGEVRSSLAFRKTTK